MKTVASGQEPPLLSTSAQTVETASGRSRLVLRVKPPHYHDPDPPAVVTERGQAVSGLVLDKEA